MVCSALEFVCREVGNCSPVAFLCRQKLRVLCARNDQTCVTADKHETRSTQHNSCDKTLKTRA